MTREEKIKYINEFCGKQNSCDNCPCNSLPDKEGYCPVSYGKDNTDEEIDKLIATLKALENDTLIPIKQEEINHPDRYANGKYECIDVMVDVFGVEATKAFCKLNAFKYLWREERKNGLNDIKKAKIYLDFYIKLSEDKNEKNE